MRPHTQRGSWFDELAPTLLLTALSLPLGGYIAFARAGGDAVNLIFLGALCISPALCLGLPTLGKWARARHRRGVLVQLIAILAAAEVAMYVGWFPRYREMCGAPLAGFVCVHAALIMFTLPIGIIARVMLRREPYVADACSHCGYSRAGLAPAAPCPECGSPPA